MLLSVSDLTYFLNNFVDVVCDKYLGGYCIEENKTKLPIKTSFKFLLVYEIKIKGINSEVIISSKEKFDLWKKRYNSQAKGQRQQRHARESQN